MIQLSDIREKSDTDTSAAQSPTQSSTVSANQAASTKAPIKETSAKSELVGYGVLYGKRTSAIQVPLGVAKEDKSHHSTGSALLDSFVSQAIAEPIPLQHLRLVNVANRQQQSSAPVHQPVRQPIRQSTPPTTKLRSRKKPAPKADTQPATTALAEKPPAAAEPETIQPASKQRKPPATPPAPCKQPEASQASPTPSTAPALSAAPISDSKTARDSAAAVGLIDINDTLLFGGDHQNLASTDPFVSDSDTESDDTGVLAYLSQQISAFTVSKLKSGFPNNTDPKVINRPDPPKHKTVLDVQTFQLSELDKEEPTSEQNHQIATTATPKQNPTGTSASTPEINILSQQVNALNQKIAELSQKLEQVTQD